jgi:hypothetical protein
MDDVEPVKPFFNLFLLNKNKMTKTKTQTHYTAKQQLEIWGGRAMNLVGGMLMGTGIGTIIGTALSVAGTAVTDQGKGGEIYIQSRDRHRGREPGFHRVGWAHESGQIRL